MSLRTLVGDLLMKIGDAISPPAKRRIDDPFNYVVDSYLHGSRRPPAVIVAESLAAFPTLTLTEAEAVSKQLGPLQELGIDLASQVNHRVLIEQLAVEQIQARFPGVDLANAGKLLMQNMVDTR